MNLTPTQIAILILVALVGRELISLCTSYFFKKVTRDDYVTKKDCAECKLRTTDYVTRHDCEACAQKDETIIARLSHEMSTVKGILLVMAINQGIDPEELKGLTR